VYATTPRAFFPCSGRVVPLLLPLDLFDTTSKLCQNIRMASHSRGQPVHIHFNDDMVLTLPDTAHSPVLIQGHRVPCTAYLAPNHQQPASCSTRAPSYLMQVLSSPVPAPVVGSLVDAAESSTVLSPTLWSHLALALSRLAQLSGAYDVLKTHHTALDDAFYTLQHKLHAAELLWKSMLSQCPCTTEQQQEWTNVIKDAHDHLTPLRENRNIMKRMLVRVEFALQCLLSYLAAYPPIDWNTVGSSLAVTTVSAKRKSSTVTEPEVDDSDESLVEEPVDDATFNKRMKSEYCPDQSGMPAADAIAPPLSISVGQQQSRPPSLLDSNSNPEEQKRQLNTSYEYSQVGFAAGSILAEQNTLSQVGSSTHPHMEERRTDVETEDCVGRDPHSDLVAASLGTDQAVASVVVDSDVNGPTDPNRCRDALPGTVWLQLLAQSFLPLLADVSVGVQRVQNWLLRCFLLAFQHALLLTTEDDSTVGPADAPPGLHMALVTSDTLAAVMPHADLTHDCPSCGVAIAASLFAFHSERCFAATQITMHYLQPEQV
jgi:hypothetical protein